MRKVLDLEMERKKMSEKRKGVDIWKNQEQ